MYFIFVTDSPRCVVASSDGGYDRLVRPVDEASWRATDYHDRQHGRPASLPVGRSVGRRRTGRKLAGQNPIYPVEISVSGNATSLWLDGVLRRRTDGRTDIHEHCAHVTRLGFQLRILVVIAVVYVTDRFRYYGY